jgi:ATP-binding protein involved in chromosome partitioning
VTRRVTNELRAALESVQDPQLDLPLSAVGMLGALDATDDGYRVQLLAPVATWPTIDVVTESLRAAARAIGEDRLDVVVRPMRDEEARGMRLALRSRMAPPGDDGGATHAGHGHGSDEEVTAPFLTRGSRTRVLAVGSGKGGVGKSTVTVNLAVSLAAAGYRVGVLDADVYGFSVAKMVADAKEPVVLGDTVVPTYAHGVRWLSMGWFVADDQPVIWRGPLLHKAITQFVSEAWWGEPDFLVVDMPPGTGDVALTLSQVVPDAEVFVVTTPQAAAQRVAQRSALAARKLRLAVRGVVENMSWFTADDGTRYELFGRGGGETLAADLGVPLLGQLPFVVALREGGDVGLPEVVADPDGEVARTFAALASRVAAQGPARVYRRELRLG